jgi:hypothetical protein
LKIGPKNKINQQNGGQTTLSAARNVRQIDQAWHQSIKKELNGEKKAAMFTLHFTTNETDFQTFHF